MFRIALLISILFATCTSSLSAGETREKEWLRLEEKAGKTSKDAASIRAELLQFRLKHPGTAQALKAGALLRDLPSPLDQLDAKNIPALEKFDWFPKETVAVLGEHRGRQGGPVTSVAFSKNGKWLASSSTNGYVRIWDPSTMRLLHTLGHGSGAYCLTFSKDNAFLVHGGGDGQVVIQDMSVEPPKIKATCKVASTPLLGLALGPAAKWFVAGGSDTRLCLWDLSVTPAVELTAANAHTGAIYAVGVAADGKTIASAGADKTIRLWSFDKNTIKEKSWLQGHTGIVYGVAWHPTDEKTLVSCGDDGFLRVWNHKDGKLTVRTQMKGAEAAAYGLTFSPSGKSLATAWSDGVVRIYTLANNGVLTEKSHLEGHFSPSKAVAFSPDAGNLATGSDDWTVRLWSTSGGPRPKDKTVKLGHLSHVYSVVFSPDNKMLATGSYDATARFWDVAGSAVKERVSTLKREGAYHTLCFHPDGKTLAAGGASTKIYTIDPATGRLITTLKGHQSHVNALAYSPNGTLASVSLDKSVRLWNVKAGKSEAITDFKTYVNSVAFAPDGKTLVCGSGDYQRDKKGFIVYRKGVPIFEDATVRTYDATYLREGYRWKSDIVLPGSVIFTEDGKHFLAGANDGMLRRWDTADPKEPEVLHKGSGGIYQLCRSPDGRYLACYGPTYTVQVLDLASGKTIKNWSLGEQFGSVAFAPDSRHLAISVGTGVALILRLEEAKR